MRSAVESEAQLSAAPSPLMVRLLPPRSVLSIMRHGCGAAALAAALSGSMMLSLGWQPSALSVLLALTLASVAGGFIAARRALGVLVEALRALVDLVLRSSSGLVQQLTARTGSGATTPIPIPELDGMLLRWSDGLLEAHRGREPGLKVVLWLTARLSRRLMARIREAIFLHSRLAKRGTNPTLADVEAALRESSIHILYGKLAGPLRALQALCSLSYVGSVALGCSLIWASHQLG
jgi:hypothetical protein